MLTVILNTKNMRKMLLSSLLLATLAACKSAVDAKSVARAALDAKGKTTVQITKVVEGNPKYRKAEALWCVETDEKSTDGSTLLLAVWRTGSDWSSAEMTDGEYEWDLNGCPR